MAQKKKSKQVLEIERDIKALKALFEKAGLTVRRESLSRGYSFAVRSGECTLQGSDLVFVDKRLPLENQLNILLDKVVERELDLNKMDKTSLSARTAKLLAAQIPLQRSAA